jgi:hypothetical protein
VLVLQVSLGVGVDLRKGKVAEQHPDHVDDSQRQHLLRSLCIKLEQTASSYAARAVRQPPPDGAHDVVLVPSSVGSALGRGGEGRSDGGAPPHVAEYWREDAGEGRGGDEEEVRDEQLQVRVCQGKGKSGTVSNHGLSARLGGTHL